MKLANDALRFALELAALAAFAYWGVQAGDSLGAEIALAVAVPLAAAVAWGLLVSPKARFPLHGAPRVGAEVVFFGGATAALATADEPVLAAVMGALSLLHLAAHHAGVRGAERAAAGRGPQVSQ